MGSAARSPPSSTRGSPPGRPCAWSATATPTDSPIAAHWVCELPDGTARIACGGTHLTSLAELAAIEPSFTVVDDAGTPVLEMANEARRRH